MKSKTVHCIDNNGRTYTLKKRKALFFFLFFFYKYRWFAIGIWRRFPEIIGGSNSIVVVGAVCLRLPVFDDDRFIVWPFRIGSEYLFEFSFDRVSSVEEEFVVSKFLLSTTRCCCWYKWVGGGGIGTKQLFDFVF